MNSNATAASPLDALPKVKTDLLPLALLPVLALIAIPLVGSFSTWVTLTFAGLAIGHDLPGRRIDDLGDILVLPDMNAAMK